ncbi:hypothetical protein DLAC_03314 [Tieghemostelium lacteum]|uniref:Uncharacterized protein n=1 Tax=Tieghemostelium lacteum TaxID=361077 RepID=A0A152A270_TIELA|nr:hypothetical protein DLAC_03314 [Tieghemostelium lacteum]|eukprot:KYR00161.1 hypothetical protein DLAC_03314 [Tieghemostelium lacteum]
MEELKALNNLLQKNELKDDQNEFNYNMINHEWYDGLSVDEFLDIPFYDKATGANFYKDDIEECMQTILNFYSDDKTLKLIGKERPKSLTTDQLKIVNKNKDFPAFLAIYSKLIVANSLANGKNKERAFRLNSKAINRVMSGDNGKNNYPELFKQFTHEVTRFFNLKNDLVRKYVNGGENFLFNLFTTLSSKSCIMKYANMIVNCDSDKERSMFTNRLTELIDMVEPTGELSKQFLLDVSFYSWANLHNAIDRTKFIHNITEEIIKQIIQGIKKSLDKFKDYKQLLADLASSRVNYIAQMAEFISNLLVKFPNLVQNRSMHYKVAEEAIRLIDSSGVITRLSGDQVKKNFIRQAYGHLVSMAFITVGGAALFFAIKSWDKLNVFNKAFLITNAFLLFCDVVQFSYKTIFLLAKWFPKCVVFTKMASVLAKAFATSFGKTIINVAAKVVKGICVVLNVAIILYMTWELFNSGPHTTVQWIAGVTEIIANIVLFACLLTCNPVLIVCGFVFFIFATLFKLIAFWESDPFDDFLDTLPEEFLTGYQDYRDKCVAWAIKKAKSGKDKIDDVEMKSLRVIGQMNRQNGELIFELRKIGIYI